MRSGWMSGPIIASVNALTFLHEPGAPSLGRGSSGLVLLASIRVVHMAVA